MTPHLSPGEFVDAAEGRLDARRAAHVESCASCAAEVAMLRRTLDDVVSAGAVPEPSPLFWDHLGQRIRVAAASAPAGEPWWTRLSWRPLAALAAAAVIILAVVVSRPSAPPAASDPGVVVAEVAPGDVWLPALEDGSFDIVLDLASDLEWDEVRQIAAPRASTVDALIQELSPAEREQLVKLLKSEIGALE
jgi:anti-sigma factor RsiW